MIAIPTGTFMMGSLKDQESSYEEPQHEVIVQSFFIGKYPITQVQYQQVMGKNPSHFKGDQRPVECVSWNDAVEFCQKLLKQTGREYRLSSEAEWEYACRAGTTTPYYFGDILTKELANYAGSETTIVGKFPPNAFGLHDMCGNVLEWCQDDWHKSYEGAPNDGSVWISKGRDNKIMRGGSWVSFSTSCRSAYRTVNMHDFCIFFTGFRFVWVVSRT